MNKRCCRNSFIRNLCCAAQMWFSAAVGLLSEVVPIIITLLLCKGLRADTNWWPTWQTHTDSHMTSSYGLIVNVMSSAVQRLETFKKWCLDVPVNTSRCHCSILMWVTAGSIRTASEQEQTGHNARKQHFCIGRMSCKKGQLCAPLLKIHFCPFTDLHWRDHAHQHTRWHLTAGSCFLHHFQFAPLCCLTDETNQVYLWL